MMYTGVGRLESNICVNKAHVTSSYCFIGHSMQRLLYNDCKASRILKDVSRSDMQLRVLERACAPNAL